jgi:transcriptional regulator with XRE-family HTH domain
MMKTLGNKLRELREANDFSLRELAKQTGNISAAFLSDLEFNRRFPSIGTLTRIASALGTTIEDLQQYDLRIPIKEIKYQISVNPALGLAYHRLAKLSPEKALEVLNQALGDLMTKKRVVEKVYVKETFYGMGEITTTYYTLPLKILKEVHEKGEGVIKELEEELLTEVMSLALRHILRAFAIKQNEDTKIDLFIRLENFFKNKSYIGLGFDDFSIGIGFTKENAQIAWKEVHKEEKSDWMED